jgi:hypothetical protein
MRKCRNIGVNPITRNLWLPTPLSSPADAVLAAIGAALTPRLPADNDAD